MWGLPSQASGMSIIMTCGRERPLRVSSSIMLSMYAESDCPPDTTGNSISISSRLNDADCRLFSLVFSQLRLPCMVLISPLWAMNRKGWASFQEGKVLVANRECTNPKALTKRASCRSG